MSKRTISRTAPLIHSESSQDWKMHSCIDLLNSQATGSNVTQNDRQITTQTLNYELPQYQSDRARGHNWSGSRAILTTSYRTEDTFNKCRCINTSYFSYETSCSSHRHHPNSPQCHTYESTAGSLIPLSVSHCSTFISHQAAQTNHTGAPFLCTTIKISANSAK
jgi:hypothetical protein